jgi:hypothetical protein
VLNPSGGSVGVGTSSPQAALHVYAASGAAFSVSSPNGQIYLSPTSGTNYFESGNGSFTASQLLYFTGYNGLTGTFGFNGSVGIATMSPTSPLQVVGLTTYASDAAAGTGGLTAGAFYKDSSGGVHVKL